MTTVPTSTQKAFLSNRPLKVRLACFYFAHCNGTLRDVIVDNSVTRKLHELNTKTVHPYTKLWKEAETFYKNSELSSLSDKKILDLHREALSNGYTFTNIFPLTNNVTVTAEDYRSVVQLCDDYEYFQYETNRDKRRQDAGKTATKVVVLGGIGLFLTVVTGGAAAPVLAEECTKKACGL